MRYKYLAKDKVTCQIFIFFLLQAGIEIQKAIRVIGKFLEPKTPRKSYRITSALPMVSKAVF